MQQFDDSRRQVVPRWRPFKVAAELGLLDSSGQATSVVAATGELDALITDWKKHKSPYHAANLVDAAIVLGRHEIALEAAQFLLSESANSHILRLLAEFVVSGGRNEPCPIPPDLGANERFRRIAAARRALRDQPRNPVLLVDLAREYSALGQLSQAGRALDVALALAPDNRFVVRAASRFLLHSQRPEEAHWVFRRTRATLVDPWLMAGEIVAATAAGGTSRLMKTARAMVHNRAIEPQHTSELAGALGTIAHLDGKRSEVRRLFDHALKQPTENVVAQAGWIARHMSAFAIPDDRFDVPRAFEARAWEAARERRYSDALALAWQWLRDEPFATRAAFFGATVASVALGDFRAGWDIAAAARLANPDDPRLILHLIYCAASDGRTDEAENLLNKDLPLATQRSPGRLSEEDYQVYAAADRGLIAFRRNMSEQGRVHYREAIGLAKKQGSRSLEASAVLNLIREEKIANPDTAIPWNEARQLVQAFPISTRAFYEDFVERVSQIAAK